jgi:tetratricopeptide (TPR) repeat protein
MRNSSVPVFVKLLVAICLIIVLTMWTYYESTKNGYVWDSIEYVINHFFWISSLSTDNVIWMFLSLEVSNWHPLTWLSWALDYQIYGGLNAWGFHLSNNILHTLNSILVFILTLVIFGLNDPASTNYPFRKDNNALVAAFLTALLFAVHPQHVESVAWIAERKDLLCQLFLLLSTLAYVKYVICEGKVKSRWFYTTMGLFAMALLSKPMAVTFPVVLLLIDVYPLRRFAFVEQINKAIRQQSVYVLLREKLPFFLLSIALILITLLAQQEALKDRPFDLKLFNAFNSIMFYLTQLWVPRNFAPLYPYFVEIGESITWKVFLPIFGVLGITLATLLAWKRGYYAWLIAWLFYLVTLSPVLGLIQVGAQGAADRYAYFPTLPVYFLVGAGFLFILNKTTRVRRFFIFLTALPFVFFLADKTRQQVQVWNSPQTLWSHAVKYYPESVRSRHNLGIAYLNQKNYAEAAFYFGENLNSRTKPVVSLAWRGLSYLFLDRYDDALLDYIELDKHSDSFPDVNLDPNCIYFNYAWAYAKSGMVTKSRELFSKVEEETEPGIDAEAWLDWLDKPDHTASTLSPDADLPSFCKILFLPKWKFQGKK